MVQRLFLLLATFSLGAATGLAQNKAYLDYIDLYKTIAVSEMGRTGIPASIKMAQALLESNAGRSDLAIKANNHFGIKCGSEWTGKTYKKKDDDHNALGFRIKSCFRSYRSAQESFYAHSEFLQKERYKDLFRLKPTDYKGWAKGLKKAGYATSSTYSKKLINLIEDYRLYDLDRMSPTDLIAEDEPKQEEDDWMQPDARPATPAGPSGRPAKRPAVKAITVDYRNDVKFIISPQEERLSKLAELARADLNRVLRYNENLNSGSQTVPAGTPVFLQRKRRNYRGRQKWHTVSKDETLLQISITYGIDLERLQERNKITPGKEPAAGQRIKIRGGKVNRPPKFRQAAYAQNDRILREEDRVLEEDPNLMNMEVEGKVPADNQQPQWTPDRTSGTESQVTTPAPQQDPFGGSSPTTEPVESRHTVQPGETLWRISKKYGVSVQQIMQLNNLQNSTIHQGMVLRVK